MKLFGGAPDADDVLVWPDGFWCFRAENSAEFLRSDDFREVRRGTVEWKLWVSHDKEAINPKWGIRRR